MPAAETVDTDVVVVGGGNAALCAALAARENGVRVLVLEAAPVSARGGNSRYTGGIVRMAFRGVEDLKPLFDDVSEEAYSNMDFGKYDEGDFLDDLGRVTQYRIDPDLAECMVKQSRGVYLWLKQKGVRFAPPLGRQAYKVDGKFTFWGGVAVETWGGGEGLVKSLYEAAEREKIRVRYQTRVGRILQKNGHACGVMAMCKGKHLHIHAKAVVLASGGFEANSEWRNRHLGPGWDLAKVRGTRYNLGDGIRMALEAGAMGWGQWSGCHAVGWDLNAPNFGDLRVGDAFQKHSYPLSMMLNLEGRRFVDEGADFRNYTYAKYGRRILEQPAQTAWQVFDSKVVHLLRDEYRIRQVTKVRANTLKELYTRIEGMDVQTALQTTQAFNHAVQTQTAFNPNAKDGRCTQGLTLPKSNWANTLDAPPFEAYGVTCGITFTFGGVRINPSAQVLDVEENPLSGLYAAGEMVGGLFYFNYPGGSGLTSGAVFGRIAGQQAAVFASR